jgi:hypothetical protein
MPLRRRLLRALERGLGLHDEVRPLLIKFYEERANRIAAEHQRECSGFEQEMFCRDARGVLGLPKPGDEYEDSLPHLLEEMQGASSKRAATLLAMRTYLTRAARELTRRGDKDFEADVRKEGLI